MASCADPLTVLHLIRPQPEGRIGGADLHIADLAGAQLRRGTVRPIVLSLANRDYRRVLAERRIPQIAPSLPLSARSLWRIRAELAAHGVQLLHSHGYESDYLAVALARRPARPLVITSHGLIKEGLVLRAKTWVNVRCFRAADAVIAASEPEARRLVSSGEARRVTYIPNGIAAGGSSNGAVPVRTELGIGAEAPIVAFVGRLAPEKRLDLFLRTAAKVAVERPDAAFLVIGSGPELEPGRRLAERLGIAGSVRFTGLRWDVDRLLRAADVLVCPSDYEGTPRAVLEAMAYGAVVVATAVGGVPDLVHHGRHGLLAAAGDASALGAATLAALDPRQAGPMREAARRRVSERFTALTMAERVDGVYHEARDAVGETP